MPRKLQEKMKCLPEAEFHCPALSKSASSWEREFGSLKGMGTRPQLWWRARVCTVCISPPAAATSPKAAILAAYRLCLNHPATLEALLISMHPDGSELPSPAPRWSRLLRPTGCTGYYLRDTREPGRRSRHLPAANTQAAGCWSPCKHCPYWQESLDGALSITTEKQGFLLQIHILHVIQTLSDLIRILFIYLKEKSEGGGCVRVGSMAGGPGCGTLLCVLALSLAGSLSPRWDARLMDHVPLSVQGNTASLTAGQIWADGESYIIWISGEM